MGNAQRLRSNHTYCDLTRHCRSFLAADLSLGILLPSDQSILDGSTKRILRSQEQALLSPKLQTFIWLVGAPRKVQTPSRGSSQALLPSPCHRPIHPFHSHALLSKNFRVLFLLLSSRNSHLALQVLASVFSSGRLFLLRVSLRLALLSEQGLTLLSLLPASTLAAPSSSPMSLALPHFLFFFFFFASPRGM